MFVNFCKLLWFGCHFCWVLEFDLCLRFVERRWPGPDSAIMLTINISPSARDSNHMALSWLFIITDHKHVARRTSSFSIAVTNISIKCCSFGLLILMSLSSHPCLVSHHAPCINVHRGWGLTRGGGCSQTYRWQIRFDVVLWKSEACQTDASDFLGSETWLLVK